MLLLKILFGLNRPYEPTPKFLFLRQYPTSFEFIFQRLWSFTLVLFFRRKKSNFLRCGAWFQITLGIIIGTNSNMKITSQKSVLGYICYGSLLENSYFCTCDFHITENTHYNPRSVLKPFSATQEITFLHLKKKHESKRR